MDQRNAEDENDAFQDLDAAMTQAAGMIPDQMPTMPIARDFEDHTTHIAVHNRLRKSKEYRDDMSPQGQKMVDAHVMQHQAFAMAIMQAQAQASPGQNAPGQQAGEQPEGKGKASPPRPQPQNQTP
jgi:hypothetical protein